MSLEAKMSFVSKYGIIVTMAVLTVIILYNVWFVNSCPIKHVSVVNELNQFRETLDPELCDDLLNKIIELNDECGIEIEPIDCG
ncbi:MAG TPA: hypothetical protein VLD64_00735 [Nitrosarchaeum sp.]|nr:hypothetical protein [Nitrosarchaeum sp.]